MWEKDEQNKRRGGRKIKNEKYIKKNKKKT